MSLQLPWPYVAGAPGSGLGNPEEFADKIQQNFDALSIAVDQVVRNTVIPTTFTPAWTGSVTNPVIGNGTLAGRYARIGKLVAFTIEITAGSTTTFGSGNYDVGLPVTAAGGRRWLALVNVLDSGVQNYAGFASIFSGNATTSGIVIGSNTFGPSTWTATGPFTFGNTDSATISGIYEGA